MAKEIEIRVWDKLKAKMYTTDYIAAFDFESKCIWVKDNYRGGRWLGLDNSNIMQYTGRKDKNGQKIFNGDVLRLEDRLVEIKYNEHNARFDCYFIKYIDTPDMDFRGCPAHRWHVYEIIGNIHENPELLEAAN